MGGERSKARETHDFPLYAAESLETVAVAKLQSIFMQRMIENTTVLNNGFSMQYFNYSSYQTLLSHSHTPVLPPPGP